MITKLGPNIPPQIKTKYWHKAQYNLHSHLHLCHTNSEMKKTNEHTSLMINATGLNHKRQIGGNTVTAKKNLGYQPNELEDSA